jgi:hypothetical protein
VEKKATDMREKSDNIEESVCDVETERHTKEAVELEGTSEATEAVEQALDDAERDSTEAFKEQSEDLEHVHRETAEYEGELGERAETTEGDRVKLSEAGTTLHREKARAEIARATEAAHRDIEFLKEHTARAEAARVESERLHEQHKSRVQSGRS